MTSSGAHAHPELLAYGQGEGNPAGYEELEKEREAAENIARRTRAEVLTDDPFSAERVRAKIESESYIGKERARRGVEREYDQQEMADLQDMFADIDSEEAQLLDGTRQMQEATPQQRAVAEERIRAYAEEKRQRKERLLGLATGKVSTTIKAGGGPI